MLDEEGTVKKIGNLELDPREILAFILIFLLENVKHI